VRLDPGVRERVEPRRLFRRDPAAFRLEFGGERAVGADEQEVGEPGGGAARVVVW
jgi:hypothetical protein